MWKDNLKIDQVKGWAWRQEGAAEQGHGGMKQYWREGVGRMVAGNEAKMVKGGQNNKGLRNDLRT